MLNMYSAEQATDVEAYSAARSDELAMCARERNSRVNDKIIFYKVIL